MVKKKADSDVLAAIEKKYGPGAAIVIGQYEPVKVDSVSTGYIAVDAAVGVGGLPLGRIVEVFGTEGSGKTTLALRSVAEAQKKGKLAALVDAEHALDPSYARKLGVDVDSLLLSQPDYGEQALDIVLMLVESGKYSIIVVDSVAALVPKAELDGEMTDVQVGLQARMMSKALRKLTATAHKTNTLVIFINQLRERIGAVGYGDPTTTPGGRALKFYSSVRLELRFIGQQKGTADDKPIGSRHQVRVRKNKVAPPFKRAVFTNIWSGYHKSDDVCFTGFEYGAFTQSGSWYVVAGEKIGNGKLATMEALRKADKKLRKLAINAVEKKLHEVFDA